MATTPDSEKTERIGWLCATIMILGFLFFLTKINACALACNSCSSADKPDVCKDEFYEIKNDGYASKHTCYPGARVEVVASPPAPKPGIMCHCINTERDAGAPSAAEK